MAIRHETEEELRASQDKYRALFESFPIGVSITDENGKVLEINRRWSRISSLATVARFTSDLELRQIKAQLIQANGEAVQPQDLPSLLAGHTRTARGAGCGIGRALRQHAHALVSGHGRTDSGQGLRRHGGVYRDHRIQAHGRARVHATGRTGTRVAPQHHGRDGRSACTRTRPAVSGHTQLSARLPVAAGRRRLRPRAVRFSNEEEPTVFVVDGEASVRSSLQWLLEPIRLKVETFESAEAFLDKVAADRSGCIVLDVRMPGLSGPELMDKLNQMHVAMPIIFLSAHGDVPLAVRTMKGGAGFSAEAVQQPAVSGACASRPGPGSEKPCSTPTAG
ncbi:MAG: response regulator [Panacagrimonas sp.]